MFFIQISTTDDAFMNNIEKCRNGKDQKKKKNKNVFVSYTQYNMLKNIKCILSIHIKFNSIIEWITYNYRLTKSNTVHCMIMIIYYTLTAYARVTLKTLFK